MKKILSKYNLIISVAAICLMTDILQSCSASVYVTHGLITTLLAALILTVLLKASKKKLTLDTIAFFMISLAMLIHSLYVLRIDVFTLQHDVGTYSNLNDGITNGGHLGYIEYFIKHKAMPDFNPFDVFSYYHPPLHHILSAIFVSIHLSLGVSYATAFESIQVLTLLYSGITMIFTYKTLLLLCKPIDSKDIKKYIFPMCLIFFHPAFIFMSGSVNNDCLTVMLICITVYYCMKFIERKDFPSLMHIAFFLGLSVIGKMNAAIYAFPIGVLLLVQLINAKKEGQLSLWIKRYCCFLVLCGLVGLSFTIRNYIRFHEKPGILSANPDSFLYVGNYSLIDRFKLPLDLGLQYPFHSIYGKNCGNTWIILLRTSLFGELWPEDTFAILAMSRIASVAAVLFAILLLIVCAASFIGITKAGKRELGYFGLSSMFILPLTYIAFVIKYPYTCSCDFRYLASFLFILSIGYLLYTCGNSKLPRGLRYALYFLQALFTILSICTCLCAI